MADRKPTSVFATARHTTKPTVVGAPGPKRVVLACPTCGAPRMDDQVRLICRFCGSDLRPEAPGNG